VIAVCDRPESMRVTTEQIRQVTCPRCGAPAGQACRRSPNRRGRVACHQERMWLAQGHNEACFEPIRNREHVDCGEHARYAAEFGATA
jgi:hypothetical protein